MSDWKNEFCNKFWVTVANANLGSLKFLPTLFDMSLDHMLVKFQQNCMVRNKQNFDLFNRKSVYLKLFSTKLWRILEDVSVAETIVGC